VNKYNIVQNESSHHLERQENGSKRTRMELIKSRPWRYTRERCNAEPPKGFDTFAPTISSHLAFQSLSSPPAHGTLEIPVPGLSGLPGSSGALLTRLLTVDGPATGWDDGRSVMGERGGEGYGDQYPCSYAGRTIGPNADTAGEEPPASRSHLLDPTIIDAWLGPLPMDRRPEWTEGREEAEPSDAAWARRADAVLERALSCWRMEWREPCWDGAASFWWATCGVPKVDRRSPSETPVRDLHGSAGAGGSSSSTSMLI